MKSDYCPGLKVKYVGKYPSLAFLEGKEYPVISIEKGWYRIYTELDEDYLFPPRLFEIVSDGNLSTDIPQKQEN